VCSELDYCGLETYIHEKNAMEETSSLYRRRRKSTVGSEGKRKEKQEGGAVRKKTPMKQNDLQEKIQGFERLVDSFKRFFSDVIRRGGHEIPLPNPARKKKTVKEGKFVGSVCIRSL
jgi:hypothetical protein